jgi:hypothetical protein
LTDLPTARKALKGILPEVSFDLICLSGQVLKEQQGTLLDYHLTLGVKD